MPYFIATLKLKMKKHSKVSIPRFQISADSDWQYCIGFEVSILQYCPILGPIFVDVANIDDFDAKNH